MRDEATLESSSHTAKPPSSASPFKSSRDTQRNVLLLSKHKTKVILQAEIQLQITDNHTNINQDDSGWYQTG